MARKVLAKSSALRKSSTSKAGLAEVPIVDFKGYLLSNVFWKNTNMVRRTCHLGDILERFFVEKHLIWDYDSIYSPPNQSKVMFEKALFRKENPTLHIYIYIYICIYTYVYVCLKYIIFIFFWRLTTNHRVFLTRLR